MTADSTNTPSVSSAILSAEVGLTMSSREIAELTGKRHDHVLRDIEKMLLDVGEDAPKFGGVYVGGNGERRPCYNLPQNLTYTLVAGYRADLRLKIVNRWMNLERGAAKPSVSVAVIEEAVRSVMGGMMKEIVRKAAREVIEPVLLELKATHHVGAVTIDAKTAKEWLEEYGCLPEGRDGPVRKVSAALRDMARMSGIELSKCPWRNAWLFPTSLARTYMDLNGRAMIRLHNAAVTEGQSALRLPGLPSTLHRIAARRAARRMTDKEMASILCFCSDALPSVRAAHSKPMPELRDRLRDGARAIMQMWSDLETEETLTRFADRRVKKLAGAL